MGHVDHRDFQLALNFLDLKAHALAELGVQVGQRFVQKQELGLPDQRPAQSHALLLAAGELAGHPVGVLAQMDDLQNLLHLLLDLGLWHLLDLQGVGHVVEHVHMGPHGVGLEHHADSPLFRRHEHVLGADHPAVDADFPGGGLLKARYDAQHSGLAAARGAEEGDELPVLKFFRKFF